MKAKLSVDWMLLPVRAGLCAFSLATAGCCCALDLLSAVDDSDPSPAEAFDLGTAAHPENMPAALGVDHTWKVRKLEPKNYRLGYALSPGEAAAIEKSYQDFARAVGYQDDGQGKFRWYPPPGCVGDMRCIFEAVEEDNRDGIEPIIERFRKRSAEASLNSLEVTTLVVSFVQAIPYEIPEDEPFGLRPPAIVVSKRKGDCDSKALLAYMILRELGVDSIIVSSVAHRHSMLGIALPVSGTKFSHDGRDYAFTEMTAKGSPIGHINRDLLSPNDWKAVPFQPRTRTKTKNAVNEPPKEKPRGLKKR